MLCTETGNKFLQTHKIKCEVFSEGASQKNILWQAFVSALEFCGKTYQ